MQLDPEQLTPQEVYKLVIGSIVPRPIAWVSTLAADGTPNLAPFSYFMAVSGNPPTLAVSVGYRHGAPKDTLANIEATGEFVVNVVTEDVAEAMNLTSGNYPPDVDEFAVAGLTPLPGAAVKPPRVAESPIHLECRLEQVVPIGAMGTGNALVIGRIVMFHVRDDLLHHGRIDQAALHAVGRLAGDGYTRTRDQFSMQRPP